MTTHEVESQLLEQDQGNYTATNPNKDSQKKRKGGLLMSQKLSKNKMLKTRSLDNAIQEFSLA